MDEKQERQREFFTEFSEPAKLTKKTLGADTARKIHTIIFSNEQLIFVFIGLVILIVTCFSLGVERGKRIAVVRQREPGEVVAEKKIIVREKARATPLKETARAPVKPKARVKPKPPVKAKAPVKVRRPAKEAPKKIAVARMKALPFTVQVAAYKGNVQAEQEKKLLESKGYGAEIKKSGKYFVVYAVGFANKQEAAKASEILRDRYKDCFVRKRR